MLVALQDQDYDDSVDKDRSHPDGETSVSYVYDDGYPVAWKQHLEVRRFIAQKEFVLPGYENKFNANDFYLTTMYGGPRYDSFQTDVVASRYGRILDETLQPRRMREYLADTYEIVSAGDDRSGVDIDVRTGSVSLRETQSFSPVGAYGDGDQPSAEFGTGLVGEELEKIEISHWSPNGVIRILEVFGEHEAAFLKEIGLRLRKTTAQGAFFGYGWLTDKDAYFGLKYLGSERDGDVARFVDAELFKSLTGNGLSRNGYAHLQGGDFRIEIEAPETWSDFEVAQHIISVLHGQASNGITGLDSGSLENVFDNYLKDQLSRGNVSVEEAMSSYKNSVTAGIGELVEGIKNGVLTAVSLVPGAGGPLVVYDLQEGNSYSAVFGFLTLGPIAAILARGANGLVIRTADGVLQYLPDTHLRYLREGLSPGQHKALYDQLVGSSNAHEQVEIINDFLKRVGRSAPDITNARYLLREAMKNVPKNLPPEAAAQAHHIVPVSLFDKAIGKKLHSLGIDLNGVENGVWLPYDDYPGRTASLHRSNHQGALISANGTLKPSYLEDVTRRLQGVRTKEKALAIINTIREELLTTKGLLFNE